MTSKRPKRILDMIRSGKYDWYRREDNRRADCIELRERNTRYAVVVDYEHGSSTIVPPRIFWMMHRKELKVE